MGTLAACREGMKVISSVAPSAKRPTSEIRSHGMCTLVMPSVLNSSLVRRKLASRIASPTPESTPSRAMKDDSIMKLSATIPRLKPIARSMPICCRRSTTERNATTPTAAMPTTSPSPAKACIR